MRPIGAVYIQIKNGIFNAANTEEFVVGSRVKVERPDKIPNESDRPSETPSAPAQTDDRA